MSVELLYTSASQGLRKGSRGFCTVISTSGMPVNLANRLEALSGYRQLFPTDSTQASQNPVAWSHVRFAVAGEMQSVVSRVAAYGSDYSGRTNKLAHHVIVRSNEMPAAGPAWLLMQPEVMRDQWDGACATPPSGPVIPNGNQTAEECVGWRELMGDAGWGGKVAAAFAEKRRRPLFLICQIDQSAPLLSLLNESVALLPEQLRWQATFTTYAGQMPPEIDCRVRCVVAGTEEARFAAARGDVIELKHGQPLESNAWVEKARGNTSRIADNGTQELDNAGHLETNVLPPAIGEVGAAPPLSAATATVPPGIGTNRAASTLETPPKRPAGRSSWFWILAAVAAILLVSLSVGGTLVFLRYENPTTVAATKPNAADQADGQSKRVALYPMPSAPKNPNDGASGTFTVDEKTMEDPAKLDATESGPSEEQPATPSQTTKGETDTAKKEVTAEIAEPTARPAPMPEQASHLKEDGLLKQRPESDGPQQTPKKDDRPTQAPEGEKPSLPNVTAVYDTARLLKGELLAFATLEINLQTVPTQLTWGDRTPQFAKPISSNDVPAFIPLKNGTFAGKVWLIAPIVFPSTAKEAPKRDAMELKIYLTQTHVCFQIKVVGPAEEKLGDHLDAAEAFTQRRKQTLDLVPDFNGLSISEEQKLPKKLAGSFKRTKWAVKDLYDVNQTNLKSKIVGAKKTLDQLVSGIDEALDKDEGQKAAAARKPNSDASEDTEKLNIVFAREIKTQAEELKTNLAQAERFLDKLQKKIHVELLAGPLVIDGNRVGNSSQNTGLFSTPEPIFKSLLDITLSWSPTK